MSPRSGWAPTVDVAVARGVRDQVDLRGSVSSLGIVNEVELASRIGLSPLLSLDAGLYGLLGVVPNPVAGRASLPSAAGVHAGLVFGNADPRWRVSGGLSGLLLTTALTGSWSAGTGPRRWSTWMPAGRVHTGFAVQTGAVWLEAGGRLDYAPGLWTGSAVARVVL